MIKPVILSGGAGTRLWPLSRRARPKQFHPLAGERTLLQATALRCAPVAGPDAEDFQPPVVLGAAAHDAAIARQFQEIDVDPALAILEPMAKNTAPAIAALAVAADGEGFAGALAVLPADHFIADASRFREALKSAEPHALNGSIVTFGVVPTRPETGYGYIRAGEEIDAAARRIAAFTEKPALQTALGYLEAGGHYWNAGIFMFTAATMIAEMETACPAILRAARAAVKEGRRDGARLYLDADAFAASPEDSIDYAVMEKTTRAVVAPLDVGWSDIGSWRAFDELAEQDSSGNAAPHGEAFFVDAKNACVYADGPSVAVVGCEDVVVVATADSVLVVRKDAAQKVKDVVARLKDDGRTELL